MSDADCSPGREPRSVAASSLVHLSRVQGRVCDELGAVSRRNQCAAEFRQLDQHCPTWNSAATSPL